jgi:ketosteroid isomerase-like protein
VKNLPTGCRIGGVATDQLRHFNQAPGSEPMSQTNPTLSQLHNQIDQWLQAIKRSDFAAICSHYTEDVRAFDAVKQLQFKQADYFAHWQQCLEMCPNHLAFDLKDIQIRHSADLAIMYALLYCAGVNEKGEVQGCWMRVTQGWQQHQGQWRIFHDHFSAPFDMVTGAALFDRQPDAV